MNRAAVESLPVIDFAPFRDGTEADRRRVAAELHRACVDIGFFYLSGHGIAQSTLDEVLALGHRFFALPSQEKARLRRPNVGGKGYVAASDGADLRERFLMTREPIPGEPSEGLAHPGKAVWPDDGAVPGFETRMKAYLGSMVRLSQQLARAFALSLGLPETHFDDMYRYLDGILFFNYYPPLDPAEAARERWSFSPHSDYGAFTLLLQDAVGGLEVRDSRGEWIGAPPVEGTFVVNLGDLFAMWTNDTYVSTLHRAANVSGRARISVPFFASPHGATLIRCIETCTGPGNPPRHPPVLAGDYVHALIERQNLTGKPGISDPTADRLRSAPG